jgi:protein O-GlcNAc transferase
MSSIPPDARIHQAREFHRRGDLARAISLYEEVLREQPALADAWQLKGMAEHQSGRLAEASASAARAIELGGETAEALALQGGILHDRGDLAGAADRYAKALAARPDWAFGHVELGCVLMDQGRAPEALEEFRAAASIDPTSVRAWNNVGIALQALGRDDEALRAFNHVLATDPRFALAHYNIARIHGGRGDVKRALEHAQLATRLRPAHAEAWLLAGDLKRRQGDSAGALAAYDAAARAAPRDAHPRIALAEALASAGRWDEARHVYRQASDLDPANLRAALGAALLLPAVYADAGQLEACRREYGEGLDRLHALSGRFRFPSPEAALADLRWTNFYLAYQGRNDAALQRRYGEFHRSIAEAAMPEFFAPRPRRAGADKVRVGFVSHFFFNSTAGRYFSSWITHLDPSRFETVVYYTNDRVADDTRTIAAAASRFRHLPGLALHALAGQIAADALDVLVYPELGMHADTFTLAGLRLAPVQCAGWGHPSTTGLPNIDWFISCEAMEPPGAEAHYTERLALLPGLGTRYAVPRRDASGSRGDFGLPEDRTLYLVPQSLFKIHPDNDALIADVLAADARGVALFFAGHQESHTDTFATRLARALEARGIDIHERTAFMKPNVPHPSYLRLNELCDVMLDTLHWSGGNTSLDALASGLPVVTLPGALMRGRQTAAMLEEIGVADLVARDPAHFVEMATRIAGDRDERLALSERIRAGCGQLFGRDEPVRALERFLERAAREG